MLQALEQMLHADMAFNIHIWRVTSHLHHCVGDDSTWGLRLGPNSIAIVDQICQVSLLGNGPLWALPEDHGLFSTSTAKVGPKREMLAHEVQANGALQA